MFSVSLFRMWWLWFHDIIVVMIFEAGLQVSVCRHDMSYSLTPERGLYRGII